MPIRHSAHTLHGGCQCKAVRFEIDVPPYGDRPTTPYRNAGADVGDVTIPAVYICHCNDCRAATTALPAVALVVEMKTVRVGLVAKSEAEGMSGPLPGKLVCNSAEEHFDCRSGRGKDTFLMCYKSSSKRSRWFCGRCGTSIAYCVDDGVIPAAWEWPKMLDLWLGCLDRADLEREDLKPERMIWCERAVPWVREWSRVGAAGIPEHPLTKIDRIDHYRDI